LVGGATKTDLFDEVFGIYILMMWNLKDLRDQMDLNDLNDLKKLKRSLLQSWEVTLFGPKFCLCKKFGGGKRTLPQWVSLVTSWSIFAFPISESSNFFVVPPEHPGQLLS
jgi:hypothetical protein